MWGERLGWSPRSSARCTGKSGTPNPAGQLPPHPSGISFGQKSQENKAILHLMGHFQASCLAQEHPWKQKNPQAASSPQNTNRGASRPQWSPPTTATATCLSHPESLARLNICSSFLVVSRSILCKFNTRGRCLNGKMRVGSDASYGGSTRSMGNGSSLGRAWGGSLVTSLSKYSLTLCQGGYFWERCSLHLVFPLPSPALMFWPLFFNCLILHRT